MLMLEHSQALIFESITYLDLGRRLTTTLLEVSDRVVTAAVVVIFIVFVTPRLMPGQSFT